MREQNLQLKDRTRLLEFEIASAIRQMRARERETILFAANLSEFHAHQHGYRLLRIPRYARLIAEAIGLDDAAAECIELASTLHDVGKIGIPDHILLDEAEMSEMHAVALREHTDIGHRLLADSASEYLQMAAQISLHHHERYDGKGYPKGLKGDEIPLPARIVTVAEAFDLLTCGSQPRAAPDIAAAIHRLTAGKGGEFDPQCVDALSAQMAAATEIIHTFADAD